jgi:hypothetical protein
MNPQAPPDTRPGALVAGGLRRGALQVFLPMFLAGQAIAWIGFAVTGAYTPTSWLEIGFSYTLMSARVPFDVTTAGRAGPSTEPLAVALGALTVALLVLAFRAGRDQARGSEDAPGRAGVAGALIAPGVALPMLVIAVPVRLAFPDADVTAVEPMLPLAAVLPLGLTAAAGLAGGLAAARETIEGRGTWGRRWVAAARGAAAILAWGVVAATVGMALVAALRPTATGWYVRTVGGAGSAGATAVVHHGMLLPNQALLVWAAASGAPVTLSTEGVVLIEVSLSGWDPSGLGADPSGFGVPGVAFLVVPLVGAFAGGRMSGRTSVSFADAALVGILAGAGGAAMGVAAAWLASFDLPFLLLDDPAHVGPSLPRLLVVGLVWGVAGGAVGAVSARLRPASSRPR